VIGRSVLGRRFARFATDVAVRRPELWKLVRPLVRKEFDSIAPVWDSMRMEDTLAPFEAAAADVDPPPRRILDLGTGTGAGALALAHVFPAAQITGVDLAEAMLEGARRNTPDDLRSRVTFERGDASALRFGDGSFDLVTHANMIPFFDELARIVRPGGQVLFAFSSGAETPIYVSADRLRAELMRRGFADFAEFEAGRGNALLARKAAAA
jgi:ubiquinone/menaquinone biosynthesis C-methylase UbiE